MQMILRNEYSIVDEDSPALRTYLREQSIEKTSPGRYRVSGEYDREQAVARLLHLSEDMMMAFDVFPTGVDTTQMPLEFANQLGVFYIDRVTG